jgi:hypothetical protein
MVDIEPSPSVQGSLRHKRATNMPPIAQPPADGGIVCGESAEVQGILQVGGIAFAFN